MAAKKSKIARLNVQAMARREPLLVGCLIPHLPDEEFASLDLASGEPTVICHFSGDKNYYDATFGMVGKEPFYQGHLLKIDDIYLTGMSFSPMGAKKMRELFHTKFGSVPFSQQWMIDKEVPLKCVKPERILHKICVLGLGYSMGPKKLVKSSYDKGYNVSLQDATIFFKEYWRWASGVKRLGDRLAAKFEAEGHLINPFGYRLVPDKSYKALNYFIQSSVSGVMNLLIPRIHIECPQAKFVTIIHDEELIRYPAALRPDTKAGVQRATDWLNDQLKWNVKMRTGFATGANLFEAK